MNSEMRAERNKATYLRSHRALASVGLMMPVLYLFWTERCGMSLADVLYLQAIFAIVLAALEVPSGYLADCLGRRRCIVAAGWFYVLGALCMCCAYDISMCIAAEIAWAIADSLQSGADRALIHGSLTEKGEARDKVYEAFMSKSSTLFKKWLFITNILGLLLGIIDLRLPFIVMLCVFFWRAFEVYRFVETPPKKEARPSYRAIFVYCFVSNRLVAWLVLNEGIILGLLSLSLWIYVPYFRLGGFAEGWMIGVLLAYCNIIAAGGSHYAVSIKEYLGRRTSYAFIWILMIIGFLLMSICTNWWLVILLTFQQVARGFGEVFLGRQLNEQVPDAYRATVNSLCSMCGRTIFVVMLCIIGWDVREEDVLLLWEELALLSISSSVILSLVFLSRRLRALPKKEKEGFIT